LIQPTEVTVLRLADTILPHKPTAPSTPGFRRRILV
jgi:hypothetical protein